MVSGPGGKVQKQRRVLENNPDAEREGPPAYFCGGEESLAVNPKNSINSTN
jgi:hypothetical protein